MSPSCARCGRTDMPLVLAEGGSICGICESEADDAAAADRARWGAALLPPLSLFGSSVCIFAGCFPLIGLVTAPLGAILAVIAIVAGVKNFLVEEAEDAQRTALVLSGAVGLLGGLVLLPLALYTCFIAILASL